MEVHRQLGPGLLESAYEHCLAYEMALRCIPFRQLQALPLVYKELKLEQGYRLDFLVDCRVVVEVKSVEAIHPVHEAQMLTYLRLSNLHTGLILNFNVALLKNGIKRTVL